MKVNFDNSRVYNLFMIERALFKDLKAHLFKKEISLIVGPRQSGKTTLMNLLRDYLIKQDYKTVFLNLDIYQDNSYFKDQHTL